MGQTGGWAILRFEWQCYSIFDGIIVYYLGRGVWGLLDIAEGVAVYYQGMPSGMLSWHFTSISHWDRGVLLPMSKLIENVTENGHWMLCQTDVRPTDLEGSLIVTRPSMRGLTISPMMISQSWCQDVISGTQHEILNDAIWKFPCFATDAVVDCSWWETYELNCRRVLASQAYW